MKIKRILAISMATMLIVVSALCVQFSVFAEDELVNTFDEATATLTISGNGEMQDYDETNLTDIPWYSYRNTIEHIVIEDGVTHIGSYAFCRETELVSVEIPDSVVSIGTAAFAGNDNLKEITIPDSVISVDSYAFGFAYDMSLTEGFVAHCGFNSAAQQYCFKSYVPFDVPFGENGEDTAVILGANYQAMWSFVPVVDGTITFTSYGTSDTVAYLYDADTYTYSEKFSEMSKTAIATHDDTSNSNLNFNLVTKVQAGKRYYLAAKYMSATKKSGSFPVSFSFTCTDHDYEMVGTSATCMEAGLNTYVCQACGDSYDEEQAALGHLPREHAAIENLVDSTCTQVGSLDSVVYCSRCEEEISRTTETIKVKPHDTVFVKTVAPTCVAVGYDLYACKNCTEEIQMNFTDTVDHTPGELKVVESQDATCTQGGYYIEAIQCTVCEEILDGQIHYTDPLGHDISTQTIDSTCTEAGKIVETCSRCDYVNETPLALAEHTPGEMVIENETAATCTKPSYYDEVIRCIECSQIISEERQYGEANGHDYAAVDFADGVVGVECGVCGDYYTMDFMFFFGTDNEILDIVKDGFVNAKDYAKFLREYPSINRVCEIDLTAGTISNECATLEDGVLTLNPVGNKFNQFSITGDSTGVQIVINAMQDVDIKLNNANITVEDTNAIVINNISDGEVAPEVTFSASEGTVNTITVNGTTGNAIYNYNTEIGACKIDLKGHGSLTINTPSTAINSGAKVEIRNITLDITSGNRAIDTKFTTPDGLEDYANVGIKGNATITLNTVDDGIRCKNFETTVLEDGEQDSTLTIVAGGDGIQMEGKKSVMNSGVINITATGYAFNCKAANFSVKSGAKVQATGDKGYSK